MPCTVSAWHDRGVVHRRTLTGHLPTEMDSLDGVAYSLWLPESGAPPRGGVVILHGAGSCKESHHDFARAARAAGLGAIAIDLRGHGESAGALDDRVLDDVAAMATYLRASLGSAGAPIALRGSSLGGYLALLGAPVVEAAAVVAICPAGAAGLRRGLHSGNWGFKVNVPALDAFLAAHDLEAAVAGLDMPVLLLHAEGDEQVPVQHSRDLAAQLRAPGSRLIAVPGGHHRSIQHDNDLQAVSLRFIERALATAVESPRAGPRR
jgi:alpha-beta hydrolase superfamily lysophospholipase